jgi:putative ABC transport system permease protein
MKYLQLILRNVGRNRLRTLLTSIVTMVLVLVVIMVWSILWLLDLVTAEKSNNFQAMVTERWAIPSRMPYSYAETLARGAARKPGDIQPKDWMTWQFYIGSLESDPTKRTRESMLFGIACDASKISTMMDGLDDLPGDQHKQLLADIEKLKATRQGIILGHNHIGQLNKRVGERFTLTGLSISKGLDLEFEIVGVFPVGRYDTLAAFNRDYYVGALDAYPRTHNGQQHPWAERNLNMMILKVADSAAFNRIAAQIENSPELSNPAVRCETMASGISSMLEPFRDLLWAMRWLLTPACLATILLVIANTISISVRERRLELAILKVLGFRPYQLLILVLGESLLLGAGAGLLSAGLTFVTINWLLGGIAFPIGFFARFMIPAAALWWGPAVGAIAALLGSFMPAWTARNVKVAEVFAKVA